MHFDSKCKYVYIQNGEQFHKLFTFNNILCSAKIIVKHYLLCVQVCIHTYARTYIRMYSTYLHTCVLTYVCTYVCMNGNCIRTRY